MSCTRGGTDRFPARRVTKSSRLLRISLQPVASAATFYIFSVFYGNQPPQLRVNAQVVTRPCQTSARPCKETREPPSQCVFSLELHAQVGICARLAKECVQAGAWTQSTDVEEAGAPLTTVPLLGIHDFSSNLDVRILQCLAARTYLIRNLRCTPQARITDKLLFATGDGGSQTIA